MSHHTGTNGSCGGAPASNSNVDLVHQNKTRRSANLKVIKGRFRLLATDAQVLIVHDRISAAEMRATCVNSFDFHLEGSSKTSNCQELVVCRPC